MMREGIVNSTALIGTFKYVVLSAFFILLYIKLSITSSEIQELVIT